MFGAMTFGSVALLTLLSSVLNSRIYGVSVIGEYALAVGTVAAVRLLSTARERPALVRELALLEAGVPRVTALVLATLAFSVALTMVAGALTLGVILLLLSGPVARPALFLPVAVSVAGYVFIGNTSENLDVAASAFRAGRQLFWVRFGDATAFILIAVSLGLANGTVWGLVLASVGAMCLGLIHRTIRMRRFMRLFIPREVLRDGFRTLPDMLRFGLKIAPGAVADGGANESGTWLVASSHSIADVGAYGRAYLLVKQLMVINQYASEMLFPTLLERRAKGDALGYARALIDSIRYTAVGLLFLGCAAGSVAPGVMRTFGSGFERGQVALTILLFVPALSTMSQIQRFALLSVDRPWLATASGFLRIAVTLSIGIILARALGPSGAALALVVGFFADLTFVTQIVIRHLDTPVREFWPIREWLGTAVAFAGGFAAGRVINSHVPYPAGMLVGGAIAGLIFVGLLVATGAVNHRDWTRFREIRGNVLVRRRGKRMAGPHLVTERQRMTTPQGAPAPLYPVASPMPDATERSMPQTVTPPELNRERDTPFRCNGCGRPLCLKPDHKGSHCIACGWRCGDSDGLLQFVTDQDKLEEIAYYDAEYEEAPAVAPPSVEALGQLWVGNSYAPHNQTIWSRVGNLTDKTVVVLGSGAAPRELYFFTQQPRWLVMSDLSTAPLRALRDRYLPGRPGNVFFAGIDAENLPFADATVDIVYGYAFVHHLPDLDRFLAETARVLRRGGRAVFLDAAYAPLWEGSKRSWLRGLMRLGHKVNPISPEDLRFTLSGGFRIDDLAERIRSLGGEPWFERSGCFHYLAVRASEIFAKDRPQISLGRREWIPTASGEGGYSLVWRHRRALNALARVDSTLASRVPAVADNQIRLVWGFDLPTRAAADH